MTITKVEIMVPSRAAGQGPDEEAHRCLTFWGVGNLLLLLYALSFLL